MIKSKKDAIILSLDDTLSEMIQLADSLGYRVVKQFIQHRTLPDINTFLGSGKIDEIIKYLDQTQETVELLIVNGELRPSQWFNLEKQLKTTVFDRIRLILAIFEQRAERKEARLQVRLAQLQYERPYVRELIHRAKAGEHPGYMAGGEYQVDDYHEMIKRQIKKITADLEKIRKDREVHRDIRYKSGFFLVSLAGYTNAGKSSLLNLLTGETVKVEGRLFSTLSTTTRKISRGLSEKRIPILLTDTVGFIQNLPSCIIDAFHSTLEEIEVADVVLLVVDGSEDEEVVEKKLRVSLQELRDLGVETSILVVFNKIDLMTPQQVDSLLSSLHDKGVIQKTQCVAISVQKQKNIDLLLDMMYAALPHIIFLQFCMPHSAQSQAFVSLLYTIAEVSCVEYGEMITVSLKCNEKIKHKILAKCQDLGGFVL